MFDFFQAIADFITTIVDYAVTSIENVLSVVLMIGKSFSAVALVMAFLPDVLTGIVVVIIAYCIIVNILNLGG